MAFAAVPLMPSSLVATLTDADEAPTRRTEQPQDAPSQSAQQPGTLLEHSVSYAELVPVGHEPIGQGSYGYVRLYKLHGTEVAVKHLRAQDWSHQELQREAQMLRKHLHPNVVLFMGVVAEPGGQLALVTEYLERGSLWDALHPRQPQPHHQLTPERRLRIARGIAKAMAYLHSSKPSVVHRDLKSANVLLTRDWDAKVGDFGLCKALPAAVATAIKTGTPAYAAPEVLRGSKHGVESDVYSFGVILWELATGEVPWAGMDAIQVAFRVRDGGRLQLPLGLHRDLDDLIVACWREQPAERPTFRDITGRLSSWTEDVWQQQQPALQPTSGTALSPDPIGVPDHSQLGGLSNHAIEAVNILRRMGAVMRTHPKESLSGGLGAPLAHSQVGEPSSNTSMGGLHAHSPSATRHDTPTRSERLLFVMVDKSVSEDLLAHLFSRFKGMEYCEKKKEKGYCHVKYSTPEAAAAAIAQLNGIEFPPLSNQHLKVIYAEQDPARDNRASGGSASNASLHHVLPHGAPPGVHGGPRSPMAMSLRARSPSPVHMPLSPAAVSALSPDVASVQETLANMSVPTAHGRFTMGAALRELMRRHREMSNGHDLPIVESRFGLTYGKPVKKPSAPGSKLGDA